LQPGQRIELLQPGGWKYMPITAPVNMNTGTSRTSSRRLRNRGFQVGTVSGSDVDIEPGIFTLGAMFPRSRKKCLRCAVF
jgi:hypothetical protein